MSKKSKNIITEAERKNQQNQFTFKNKIIGYSQKQEKFKELEKEFKESKNNFKVLMDIYFKDLSENKVVVDTDSLEPLEIVVTKIQRSSINYNIPKLEKVLGKKKSKEVIKKNHTITDMDGLIKYLKLCGANPNIFKKFIVTTKQVDEESLNQLNELGKLSVEDLEDCYKVNKSEPYYKVTSKPKKV